MAKQRTGGLYKDDRTGNWIVRFRAHGQEYRRSTLTKNKAEAERKARSIRAEVESNPPKEPKRRGVTLEMIAEADQLEHEQRGVTPGHLRALGSKWNVILEHCNPETLLTEIDYDWVREYEGRRRAKGIRGQTITRESQAIKRGLKIAKRRGWIDEMPEEWPTIRRDPQDPKKSGKYHSPEAVRLYLAGLHQDARDEVEFIFLTGIRFTECKRVQPGWFEPLGNGTVMRMPAWATKSRSERVVPVPGQAMSIVKRRMDADPDRKQVFTQKDFKKHRAAVTRKIFGEDASTITLRDMRHTYASNLMRASSDPDAVLKILGHTDLSMTRRYLSSTLEDLSSAVGMMESRLGHEVGTRAIAEKSEDDSE